MLRDITARNVNVQRQPNVTVNEDNMAFILLFYGTIILFVMTLLYTLYLLEKEKIKEIDNAKKII